MEIIELENKIKEIKKKNIISINNYNNRYNILEKRKNIQIIILLFLNIISIDIAYLGNDSITFYSLYNLYSYLIIFTFILFALINKMINYTYEFISETVFDLF